MSYHPEQYKTVGLYFFRCHGDRFITGLVGVIAPNATVAQYALVKITEDESFKGEISLYIKKDNVFLNNPKVPVNKHYHHYWVYEPSLTLQVTVPENMEDRIWVTCLRSE